MVTHYDDKGKIFTNIVAKEAIKVHVQTINQRILGFMYVQQGQRIKDELNREERFLAMTDAVVLNSDGSLLFEAAFLAVNRREIVWVIPESEIYTDSAGGGGGE
jgi:hypothetical protein